MLELSRERPRERQRSNGDVRERREGMETSRRGKLHKERRRAFNQSNTAAK